MIKKLRQKFILSAMLSLVLVLFVILSGIHIMNYNKITSDADNILTVLNQYGGKFPKYNSPERKFRNPLSPETPYQSRYFTVSFNSDGSVGFIDTGKVVAIDTESAQEYAIKVYESGTNNGFYDVYRYGKFYSEEEDMTLIIFLDCSKELSNLYSSIIFSVILSLIGIFSVLILVIISSKFFLKPVYDSYKKQKQFITDAGHEIKTPLAIIDANLELIEMENGESEWTGSIRNQIQRLTSLTSDLITLSKMEENDKIIMEKFSLSNIVCEVIDPFIIPAVTHKKSLDYDVDANIELCGDEKSIRRLINILLDNAIKYTPENGSIFVSLKKQDKDIILSVKNDAENLKIGDMPYLFDRFYREDKSRNSSVKGYGIGLSVAKAIVDSHKGKISAKSPDGKTFVITAVFNA